MRCASIPEADLLPFEVIVSATQGDLDALSMVCKHFAGYITTAATRIFYDEYGQSYRCVDHELKKRIENKLVARIIQAFKI